MKNLIVAKIGTAVLTNGEIEKRIAVLAADMAQLLDAGFQILVVTSGAVGQGRKLFGDDFQPVSYPGLDERLIKKRAQASVGQSSLIRLYEREFDKLGYKAAQALLTQTNLAKDNVFLEIKAVIETLLSWGVIPILNENDVESDKELKYDSRDKRSFGDNDVLTKIICGMLMPALKAVIFLTDQDGVYESFPPQNNSKTISVIYDAPKILANLTDCTNKGGTGGMLRKVEIAQHLSLNGVSAYIANGVTPDVLARIILEKEDLGTFFPPFSQFTKGSAAHKTTKL